MQNSAATTFFRDKPLPKYVEVALPIPLRQTFTYILPAGLQENIKIGARLLVPFGKRQLTGYAVALHEILSDELEIEESALREAIELLDAEPLLTAEIIKLTNWTADYYASAWGEVLKASLPAGINANVEQIVSITAHGRDELIKVSSAETIKVRILCYLSENNEMTSRELGKKFGVSKVQKAVRELVNQDLASVFSPHNDDAGQTETPQSRKTFAAGIASAEQQTSVGSTAKNH